MQVIAPAGPVAAAVDRPLGAAGGRASGRGAAPGRARRRARPFDLARGPAAARRRCCGWRRRSTWRSSTMHHIVVRRLVDRRAAPRAGGALRRPARRASSRALPELPVQYADFAVWQRELAARARCWRPSSPAGASGWPARPPLLELPTDRPRPAVRSFRGASLPVAYPADLSRDARGARPAARGDAVHDPARRLPGAARTARRPGATWWSARRSPTAPGWRPRG